MLEGMQIREALDESWHPPAMVQSWRTAVPLESIRFAAANRLCVNLHYQNSWRLIEPYSLRRSSEGNLLLYATKHETGEARSYRVDRIQGIEVSTTSFVPRYVVELTPAGPLHAPVLSQRMSSPTRPVTARTRLVSRAGASSSSGPVHVFRCSVCGKLFRRKTYDATLNQHKDKQGHPCYGRFGTFVKTE